MQESPGRRPKLIVLSYAPSYIKLSFNVSSVFTTSMPQPQIPSNGAEMARPILIMHLLNWFFFGVLSMQVYTYFLGFPKDRKRFKFLVFGIYALETVQNFLAFQSAIHDFVDNFGNFLVLNTFGTMWFSFPILCGIIALVSQMFYAWRINVLSKSRIFPILVILLSIFQLAGAIWSGIVCKEVMLINHDLTPRIALVTGIWTGPSALCDIIIAICMSFYLSRFDTEVMATKNVRRQLVQLIIGTGSLTALMSVVSLVLLLTLPQDQPYYIITMGVLGKLYSNSMLVVLNSRKASTFDNNVISNISGWQRPVDNSGAHSSTEVTFSSQTCEQSGFQTNV